MSEPVARSNDGGPTTADVTVLATVAGVPVDAEAAARIAASIGPALRGFRSLEGTLPFDLEPASFTVVQNGGQS